MVGRKVNLKFLISKIREARATVVKTTEFVQGQTSRWGLAWSFLPPKRNLISPNAPIKTNFSFMLEVIMFLIYFFVIHDKFLIITKFDISFFTCPTSAATVPRNGVGICSRWGKILVRDIILSLFLQFF